MYYIILYSMWKDNIQNGLTFSPWLFFLYNFFSLPLFKLQKGWHGIKVDIILTSAFDIKSCLRRVQSLDMEALNLKVRKRNRYDLYYRTIHSTRTTSCGMFVCYTLGGPSIIIFFSWWIAVCDCYHYVAHSRQFVDNFLC